MKNWIEQLNNLNIQIGYSDFFLPSANELRIQDQYLRNTILQDVEHSIGTHVLKLSLPIEEYARYKNNSISSFIRKDGAIVKHEGHHELKTAEIVDGVFYRVSQYYTQKIFEEFHGFFQNIQSVIYSTEHNIINTINYNFDREYLNELSSITEFFEEIYEDIGDISASKDRCNAYLTHVIGNRQKTLKLIQHFLNKLWQWPNRILLKHPNNVSYLDINYNELSNDYLICRQSISNYVVCLVFEYILSGNIDERSKDKIIKKIDRNLKKFRDVDKAIKDALKQRNINNSPNYYWYTLYENYRRNNDREGINWFIRQYTDNDNFEIKEVTRIFNKSKLLLENIVIE